MSRFLNLAMTLVAIITVVVSSTAPLPAQTCAPLNNGHLADVFYEGTVIFWDPVVEYKEMVLTVGGPCEDIVRTFGPNDQISFDLAEIQRVTDGQYTWELHRVATVDPAVQEDLQAARGTGEEDALWWNYFQKGSIPTGPYMESGSFTVSRGAIITPSTGEEKSATVGSKGSGALVETSLGSGAISDATGGGTLAPKTVLTNADGVIRNSLCVGFDCPNSPTFSDSTILLMENNTRIKFDDTSTINSFPRNDWEIEANSNLNGGPSYLGFNDCGQSSQGGCASDLVFAVEAGARTNALYVENDGDVGFGTSNPVVRLHTIDGDTPALRLEQDGSSGFAPQTWDVAGNETSFFVRDATNGSTLPFRIRPGAGSNSLVIDSDDDIGIGVLSPSASLHVKRTSGNATFQLETTASATAQFNLVNGGGEWQMIHGAGGAYNLNRVGVAGNQFVFSPNGNLDIQGTLTTNGPSCGGGCDRVFAPDYELPSIEEHALEMWQQGHLPAVGPTEPGARFNVSEKTGGILNELEKAHIYIERLNDTVEELKAELHQRDQSVAALEERLARLEASAQSQEQE